MQAMEISRKGGVKKRKTLKARSGAELAESTENCFSRMQFP